MSGVKQPSLSGMVGVHKCPENIQHCRDCDCAGSVEIAVLLRRRASEVYSGRPAGSIYGQLDADFSAVIHAQFKSAVGQFFESRREYSPQRFCLTKCM